MVLSKEEERWRSVDLASHEPRHELTAATVVLAARVIITKVARAIILWRQQPTASGLAQIRADRQHTERALTMPRRAQQSRRDEMGWDAALDNTLIEVCGGTAWLLGPANAQGDIVLAMPLGAFAFRECARLFLSLARPKSACAAAVPICDFKLFQTHARCDFNESSLDSRFSLMLALTQHLSPFVILQGGSYSYARAAPSRKRRRFHRVFVGIGFCRFCFDTGKGEIQQNDLFGMLEVKVLPFLSCASNFFNYTDGNHKCAFLFRGAKCMELYKLCLLNELKSNAEQISLKFQHHIIELKLMKYEVNDI